ncbi:MAG: carbohydrate ABC transporter permease [Eubacteriales bacterium]|nr:carbohydrate ABC transporter permease [Eubacteriales bacterium]
MKTKKLPIKIVTYAVFIAVVIVILFPIYVTVITAFKSPEQSAGNFFSLPTSLYLENFKEVMSDENFGYYVVNSLFVAIFSVGLTTLMIPMVSFSIARNKERKRYYQFLYAFFVAAIFCPFTVLMVPVAQLCGKLGLMNQGGLILLYAAFALGQGVFLFTGYFKSIPLELEEASKIDGCTLMRTYWRIVFPLAKPMTATLAILNTLWIWNDFQLPLIILNKSAKMWTLPIYQYNFKSAYTFNYNLAFASFLFSIVPMMLIYAFFQKYIIQGLTAGAVKS